MRIFPVLSVVLKLIGESLIMAASIVSEVIDFARKERVASQTIIAELKIQIAKLSEDLAASLANDAADAEEIAAAEAQAEAAVEAADKAEEVAAEANARAESLAAEELAEEKTEQELFDAFKAESVA
jgi:hypothetical protein